MKQLLTLCALAGSLSLSHAFTTVDATHRFAYGANVGWVNWQGDLTNGAVVGEYVCSGLIYSANTGWISLGSGNPANGFRYQNDSAADYGVNLESSGRLRGLAYGANIGWINFEETGAPTLDLATGRFSGHAWSANCGWISLSNAFAYVQSATIASGTDVDGDGIPDAFELAHTGGLGSLSANHDADGDGLSDGDEFEADTDPLDPEDSLRIVRFLRGWDGPDSTYLNWTSKPTRLYAVQRRPAFDPGSPWTDLVVLPWLGADNASFTTSGDQYFFRIRAFRPPAP